MAEAAPEISQCLVDDVLYGVSAGALSQAIREETMTDAPAASARFSVAHRLTRRLRIVSPLLAKNPERCYILEILLRKRPEIKEVRSVPAIGSVTLHYDSARLPEANLLTIVDAVIGNISARPAAAPPAAASAGPVQECAVAVEGMTCASCALLI